MAEKNKNNKSAEGQQETNGDVAQIRNLNVIKNSIAEEAFDEIEKQRDQRQKQELMDLICAATYTNLKSRSELRSRRREEDITKARLDASKVLLERVIGFETEIDKKTGKLIPIKDKPIAEDQRLTKAEYRREKAKMEQEFQKKSAESDEILRHDIEELKGSYEGRFAPWWD